MPYYLTHFSYAPESWKGLIAHPRDRRDDIRPFFEAAGLELVEMFFEFGQRDGFTLSKGENVDAAAVSIAAAASGAMTSIETTVLLTAEEMVEALQKAAELPYKSPAEEMATA